jgi:hypothetical protein
VQKESLHFSATLSTCFCRIEGTWGEVVVVAQIVKKINFAV